eukprot:gene4066-5810_t
MKFNQGDVVLAEDNGKAYPAKILKVHNIGNDYKYFIHFDGWARRFDVWIDSHLVYDINDPAGSNHAKGTDGKSKKATSACKKKIVDISSVIGGNANESGDIKKMVRNMRKGVNIKVEVLPTVSPKKLKRKFNTEDEINKSELNNEIVKDSLDFIEEPVENISNKSNSIIINKETIKNDNIIKKKQRKELLLADLVEEDDEFYSSKINMPFSLKKHLVDEWHVVTKEPFRLMQMPAKVTVEQVIQDFIETKKEIEQGARYKDLMEGLLAYFDKALPSILLYRQERAQFDRLMENNIGKTPSQIYGAAFLLRFYVRLPKLLTNVFMSTSELNDVLSKLNEFLKFVQKNVSFYVDITEYIPSDEAMEYLQKNFVGDKSKKNTAAKRKSNSKK